MIKTINEINETLEYSFMLVFILYGFNWILDVVLMVI